MTKRLVVILYGLHTSTHRVDSLKSNLTDKLRDSVILKDYIIEYFLITKNSPKLQSLLDIYKPTGTFISDNINKVEKLLMGLNIVKNYMYVNNNKSDLLLLTRFDIFFHKNLENIDVDKFNIVSILEHKNVCDDNLYIFPIKYFDEFLNIVASYKYSPHNERMYLHFCKNIFEKIFDVNYICNEYVFVTKLSFFSIV
jgi:hypothetical protein